MDDPGEHHDAASPTATNEVSLDSTGRSYGERPNRPSPRPALGSWGIAGAFLFAAGAWALAADLEGWNAVWYLPAWYGYLLMLDGLILVRRGTSFLAHRRRELAAMLFWSVPFWYLFELADIRLEDWYYVFVLHTSWLQEAVGMLAFATVLPACFLHAELLTGSRWASRARCRRWRISQPLQAGLLIFGVAATAGPLLWPRQAFPLIWFAPFALASVPNYRLHAQSLLADLEAGRPGRLYRLLVGGMLAGAVWEGLNYWARCKWIYTVPGFETAKVFEMPIPGFFGFPVFAVSAFSGYSLLCRLVRGKRWWERSDTAQKGVRPVRGAVLMMAVAMVFDHFAFQATLVHNVGSRRPLLRELRGASGERVQRLRQVGAPTPERLVKAVEERGLASMARASRIDPSELDSMVDHARIALHKGMGSAPARLLMGVGIETAEELAAADPEVVHRELVATAEATGARSPRPAEVRVWIRAARFYGHFHR
jgi:hypothetical protein